MGIAPLRTRSHRSSVARFVPLLRGLKYLCAYAHTQMTKTISLSDEAYRLLRRHKLASESFSDAVTRLTRQGGRLSEVIGLYPELKGRTGLAESVRENRKRLDRRVGAR